jgi:hypothetical protein
MKVMAAPRKYPEELRERRFNHRRLHGEIGLIHTG